MYKSILFVILGLSLLLPPSQAQDGPYMQVRLDRLQREFDPGQLAGMDLEIMKVEDSALTLCMRAPVFVELAVLGYSLEVEIADMEAFYASRLGDRGDFDVFHTYSETVDEIHLLHSEFPELTTAPVVIGQSIHGNDIWAMKISDNPDLEEENEPEVLFDAQHHAREIMTVEVVLSFMRYLCENYETDPYVRFLVDNRQIWFIPTMNPDGTLYNEQTNPNGGGMWRKNRRYISGSCWGVDLNRNYPYEWGGEGTSDDPCENIYMGTEPASEPEVQALMNLVMDHEFVIHQSFHSVVGVILFPWAYTSDPAPDFDYLNSIAAEMTSQSGYDYGPGEDLYLCSGTTTDWTYGDEVLKNKIYAFTTEIGGSGFWPAPSEREPLIAENIYHCLYASQVAGAYIVVDELVIDGGDGNGQLDPGETVNLILTLKNPGPHVAAENVQATLSTQDGYIEMENAESIFGFMAPGAVMEEGSHPFRFSVDASTPDGHCVKFNFHLSADPGVDFTHEVLLYVGEAPYRTDFEDGESGWTVDPSQTASTGDFVCVDPNPTDYQPDDDTTPSPGVMAFITGQNVTEGFDDVDNGVAAVQSPVWDLSGATDVHLQLNYFFGQRDWGDDADDFFRMDLSNDGGATYPSNLLTLGDETYSPDWIPFEVNLGTYLPLTHEMRLRIQVSDGTVSGDVIEAGIDDIVLRFEETNQAPPHPLPASPADGEYNLPDQPTLEVYNSVDPDSNPLTYGFRVYHNVHLTDLVSSVDGIAEGVETTAWQVPVSLEPGTYWWRAYAADPQERGDFMTANRFTVGPIADVPPIEDVQLMGFQLGLPSPNPMSKETRIPYYTSGERYIEAHIVDVSGRIVTRLYNGFVSSGHGSLSWNARDMEGRKVGSGFYWVRVRLGDEQATTKLLVVE